MHQGRARGKHADGAGEIRGGSVHERVSDPFGIQHVGDPESADDEAWTAHVEPAVGDNAYKRLSGCIEDLTIPRVRGDLHAVTDR